ncbi:MAG: hypothetical protein ACTSPM_04015 [Candidatus Heimdallarchaeota archaeon]
MNEEASENQLRTAINENSSFFDIPTQIRNWFQKKNWSLFGFTFVTFLFLTCLGILVRLLAAYHFREYFPFNYSLPLWERGVDFNPSDYYQFNGYHDFDFYYVEWATAWFEEGWYPFTDWTGMTGIDPLYYYSYPPIFLYFILLIWRPGMSVIWIAMPLIITDAACAGMVYLIVEKLIKRPGSKGIAFFAGMLMVFAPINIIYDGIYWLNPGPVILLTLISFYFIIERKWWQVFFWLAIATMTKQNALFFTYPIFFVMLGEKVREKGIKKASFESGANVILFISVCLLASIPWIFITPIRYFVHMLFPGKMLTIEPIVGEPHIGQPIPISYTLFYYNIRGVAMDIIAFLVNSMLLMIISASVIGVYLLWRSFKGKIDSIEIFELLAIYTIWTHTFMPRGVFKFYSTYYVPIILIALISSLSYYKTKKIITAGLLSASAILFMGFNIWHTITISYFIPILLLISSIVLLVIVMSRTVYKQIISLSPKATIL